MTVVGHTSWSREVALCIQGRLVRGRHGEVESVCECGMERLGVSLPLSPCRVQTGSHYDIAPVHSSSRVCARASRGLLAIDVQNFGRKTRDWNANLANRRGGGMPISDATNAPLGWDAAPDVPGGEVSEVRLEGRWTRLRPIFPPDIEWLYALSARADTTFRWRYHGETPSPQSFANALWQTVLAQFVAEEIRSAKNFGLVVAYAADNRNGHARVAVLFDSNHRDQGWPIEACALFISYLFAMFPLRKLYFEGPDYNVEQYASALRNLLIEEGRLKGHLYYDGRYADFVTLALYRETWEHRVAPIVENLTRR
jgi:RimJ/RimL family protein N-acetyltransferase